MVVFYLGLKVVMFSIISAGVGASPLRPLVKRASHIDTLNDDGEAIVSAGKAKVEKKTEEEFADFEVITDEERIAAQQIFTKELLTYAGYTLLVVIGTVATVVCFLMDPRACLVAFGTGSPCCLAFPCYRELMQYTNPTKLIKANVNVYVPGIYIEEDGTLREYHPSPDEMDCLYDLVSEFVSIE